MYGQTDGQAENNRIPQTFVGGALIDHSLIITCLPTFSWKAAEAARLTFISLSNIETMMRALKIQNKTTYWSINVPISFKKTIMVKEKNELIWASIWSLSHMCEVTIYTSTHSLTTLI